MLLIVCLFPKLKLLCLVKFDNFKGLSVEEVIKLQKLENFKMLFCCLFLKNNSLSVSEVFNFSLSVSRDLRP